MNIKAIIQGKRSSVNWIKFLAVALLILGLIFRFTNLDLRPYWYDETYTSLQISGYSDPEIRQQLNGQITTVEALQKYQYPSPEKSVADTVRSIAEKEPQLTPLYFVLTRFWVQLFGNFVVVTRSFSAMASSLTLLCIYWFCSELFKSRTTAWVAVALCAVSPFHVLYAQEARPPSLWALTVLLSHIAILRAIRLQTPVSWILYTLSSVVTLYTYLFSVLVLVGHGIYILINERFRITKTGTAFSISFAFSVGSFVPWLIVFLPNISKANQGSAPAILSMPFYYAIQWIRNIGLLFADFSIAQRSPKVILIPYLVILLVATGIVAYAIYFLCHTTPKPAWLFLLTAIAVPFLPLVLKDLISGGGASTVGRYLVPSLLGVQIAVAYLFTSQIFSAYLPQSRWHALCRGVMFSVLLLGVLSCLIMTKSELWWNKAEANLDRQLATQVINQARSPLLVSDSYFVFALSISHSLNQKVQFLLAAENSVPTLPINSNNEIFLYRPSQILLDGLKQRHTLEQVTVQQAYSPGEKVEDYRLWRIIRR